MVDDGDVGGAGEDREPGAGEADDVAGDAAAEQAEHLDAVLGAGDVGVADHEEDGGLGGLDLGGFPAAHVELLDLAEQGGPLLGVGRGLEVGMVPGRVRERLGRDLAFWRSTGQLWSVTEYYRSGRMIYAMPTDF